MRRGLLLIACALLVPFLFACGGGSSAPPPAPPPPQGSSVTVNPGTMTLSRGQTQPFSATVTGATDQAVFWQVVGAQPSSGDSAHGFISTSGTYVAPTVVPNPATITIKAVSLADATKSGTATVTIQTG